MLVIRLSRTGKKNQPFFKIVVVDKRRSAKAGHFTDDVGFWNPLTKQSRLDADKIKKWIANGAKPSSTVYNLLISKKILAGKKIAVNKKSKKVVEPKKEGAMPQAKAEAPKAEVKPESKQEEAAPPPQLQVQPEEKKEEIKPEAPINA